jgi:hypothetical protein
MLRITRNRELRRQPMQAPRSSSKVVNNHFTVGKKLPSIYLKVFSNGTTECHALKDPKQTDTVKMQRLSEDGFAELKSALDQPELRGAKGRYEFPRVIIDSWSEWDLTAPGSQLGRDVTISFGGGAQEPRPYPEALAKLGCQIIKIRAAVYGDNTDYYRQACVIQAKRK